jgi:hypothetical protein
VTERDLGPCYRLPCAAHNHGARLRTVPDCCAPPRPHARLQRHVYRAAGCTVGQPGVYKPGRNRTRQRGLTAAAVVAAADNDAQRRGAAGTGLLR